MKVVFCSYADPGHLFPLLPLAEAMRAAGHDLTFVTGGDFVAMLRTLGFKADAVVNGFADELAAAVGHMPGNRNIGEFIAATQSVVKPDGDPDPALLRTVQDFLTGIVRATERKLTPVLAQMRPDLVVYEDLMHAAAVAGALNKIPTVAHSAAALDMPQPLRGALSDGILEQWPHLDELSPHSGDLLLDTCPPGFAPPVDAAVPRIPIRPVPWGKPGTTMPPWVTAPRERPLVYVTMGTVALAGQDRLHAALAGLAELPVDVLVASGNVALGDLPESIKAERFVRQDLVMPLVDVAVHHGGSGTLLGCLAHGVPQVALPFMADQFTNAGAITRSGVGLALPPSAVSADAIRDAVAKLLASNGFTTAADRFRQVVAGMPAPAEVVAHLEALVTR